MDSLISNMQELGKYLTTDDKGGLTKSQRNSQVMCHALRKIFNDVGDFAGIMLMIGCETDLIQDIIEKEKAEKAEVKK